MKKASTDLALLAPVPQAHLETGIRVCDQEGKVAFGSCAWDTFSKVEGFRCDLLVDTYIYASHAPGSLSEVSWYGRYIGYVDSIGGAHPEGMRFRPPSTAHNPSDNQGHWAIFWEIEALEKLPQAIPTNELRGRGKPKHYGRSFVPEGPIIIEHPWSHLR